MGCECNRTTIGAPLALDVTFIKPLRTPAKTVEAGFEGTEIGLKRSAKPVAATRTIDQTRKTIWFVLVTTAMPKVIPGNALRNKGRISRGFGKCAMCKVRMQSAATISRTKALWTAYAAEVASAASGTYTIERPNPRTCRTTDAATIIIATRKSGCP